MHVCTLIHSCPYAMPMCLQPLAAAELEQQQERERLTAQYLPPSPNMALLLAYFASGASSLFGSQCLVEAVTQSYLLGRTFNEMQVKPLLWCCV